ncbi:hypothetical protein ACPV34_06765 [Photobacterium damselae]|uniref:hypothetical protein n=1 Tax=Photobacterium damselae TaxID=38293 RepID=UPI0040696A9A
MLSNQTRAILDKLVATYLSKGVQPSDMADTMFEEHYVDMNIKKTSEHLIMTYSFEELDDDYQAVIISMKYTYNKDMFLQIVEQKIGKGRYKIQWDRSEDLKAIAKELTEVAHSEGKLKQVIDNLPSEIQAIVKMPLVA